jgi:hypothetical protein
MPDAVNRLAVAWRHKSAGPSDSRWPSSIRATAGLACRSCRDLGALQVDDWLEGLTEKLATRSLQGVHAVLKRAIRQAQVRDKVLVQRGRAGRYATPKDKPGRPSRAMTLEQATALIVRLDTAC